MGLEEKIRKPYKKILSTAIYTGILSAALGFFPAKANAQQTALVEFIDPTSAPLSLIIPETGSSSPVNQVSYDFSNGNPKKLTLNSADGLLHTGYIRVTPATGQIIIFPQFAVGQDSGFNYTTEVNLIQTADGVDGKATFKYTVNGQLYTAAVPSSTPMQSFELGIKNNWDTQEFTGIAWVCTAQETCNYRITLTRPDGSLVDQFYTSLNPGTQNAFYPFEKSSNIHPGNNTEYLDMKVDCEHATPVVALDQSQNSFTATPVTTGIGRSSGPTLKLSDFFINGTNIGGAKISDMPPVTNATVTYKNLTSGNSTTFPVNNEGIVKFSPVGSSTPVFLPSGKYDRIISATGFVVEHETISMPDTSEIQALMDNIRFNTKLEAKQWTQDGKFPSTNFFPPSGMELTCYLNTTGMDLVNNSYDSSVHDVFKHWVNYTLPQQGIKTKYI